MLGHLGTNLFQTWYDAKFYLTLQFDLVLITFMFTQGYRVTEILELVQLFCCKVHNNYYWLCKGDDREEVL